MGRRCVAKEEEESRTASGVQLEQAGRRAP